MLYQYAVKASNANGDSANYSHPTSAIAQCPALKQPENFGASSSDTGILLSWKVTNASQDGTQIALWNATLQKWEIVGSVTGQTNRFNETAPLSAGQTYYYAVRAYKDNNLSAFTAYQGAQVPAIALAGPTNVSVQKKAAGQLQLQWQDKSNNEDAFVVLRYDAANEKWV